MGYDVGIGGNSPHTHPESEVTGLVSDLAAKQPSDSDLTAIAALSTTSYGRSLLAAADAAALRTLAGLGTAAVQNTGAFDASGAAAAAQAASQPLDSDLTAIAALTTTSTGRSLLAAADAAAIRTIAGSETAGAAAAAQAASQPLDSDLTAIAALSTTSFGRGLLAAADAAALRSSAGVATGKIQITADGGGSVLTTGLIARFVVPFNCTITDWEILGDQSGSIQFDLWKNSYANYPPTIANTITGSAKPLVSAAAKATSSTLTGWTTALVAGDIVFVNIDSVAAMTSAVLALSVTRS